MGIPLGWNIVRDEARDNKDVLRADVSGRSPIRRRHARTRNGSTPRFVSALEHAPRLSPVSARRPPAPRVPLPEEGVEADGNADADADANANAERDELRRRMLGVDERPRLLRVDDERPRMLSVEERLLPELTPGFAPAHPRWAPDDAANDDDAAAAAAVDGPRTLTWTSSRRHAPYARPVRRRESSAYASDDEPPTSTSHPPLRRVGHRRIADGPLPASSLRESWSPASTIDGLGDRDRDRSNSVSSTASNLPWQTFLTTVVPDPLAPTAESSFASAAASASFTASSSRASSSNSNSTASDRTHLTVPSLRGEVPESFARGQIPESFSRACESSDEGESTASDTEDEATANPLSRRRLRPSYFADAPPSARRYGRSVLDTSSDARRYVRSFYSDQHGDSFATVDDEASPASPLDQELRDARSLLERLTRRGDIGDDFWASVGLTRSFSDGMERVGRL